jgi:hypothetical protein
MSKVTSSRGSMVDFELMNIMANINAPKAQTVSPSAPKYYNVEHDIAYVEAISTEQFLREQLANSIPPTPEVTEEAPVKLEIVEPSTESDDFDDINVDNVTETKNNKRK